MGQLNGGGGVGERIHSRPEGWPLALHLQVKCDVGVWDTPGGKGGGGGDYGDSH